MKTPLLDALDHGFGTVEADVHLIDGELYVGHETPTSLTYPQSFRAMYLEPLRQRIENNNGSVYKDVIQAFNLMIFQIFQRKSCKERKNS